MAGHLVKIVVVKINYCYGWLVVIHCMNLVPFQIFSKKTLFQQNCTTACSLDYLSMCGGLLLYPSLVNQRYKLFIIEQT